MPEHTIVVLGALDKESELVNQFSPTASVNGSAQSASDTTECRKQITVDGASCNIVLREPAVNVEDTNLISDAEQQRFGQANALIVWYSITDRDGFLKAKDLCNKARALRTRSKHGNIPIALNDNCPVLLMATHPPYSSSDQWKVTYSEGDILSKELRCAGFFECTLRSTSGEAVRNESVERAIAEVVREIRKVEGPKSKQSPAYESRANGSSTTASAAAVTAARQAPSSSSRTPAAPVPQPEQRPPTTSSRTQSISRRTSMIFEKLKFGSSRKSSMDSSPSSRSKNTSTPNLLSQINPSDPASIQYSDTRTNGNPPAQNYSRTSSFSLRSRHFSLSSISLSSPTKQQRTSYDRSKSSSMVSSGPATTTPTTTTSGSGSGSMAATAANRAAGRNGGGGGYGGGGASSSSAASAAPSLNYGTGRSVGNGGGSGSSRGPPKIDLGNLGVSDWGNSLRWPTSTIQE